MDESTRRSKALRVAGALLVPIVAYLAFAPAAFAAECLEYEFFFRRGGVFPNPWDNTDGSKPTGHLTLLVVDEDLNIHLARVKRDAIYNSLGQEVDSGENRGTFETDRSVLVPNLWDGRNNNNVTVASGVYSIRLFADSSLCGREEDTINITVVH